MQADTLLLLIIAFAVVAFFAGRARALTLAGGFSGIRSLHSLPRYYGGLTALWCFIPALCVMILWLLLQDDVIASAIMQKYADAFGNLPDYERGFLLNKIQLLAEGKPIAGESTTVMKAAAADYRQLQSLSARLQVGLVVFISLLCLLWGLKRIQPDFKARNRVETIFGRLFLICSSLAIITTLGIILSVLFEALRFFQSVSVFEFLFGTHWSPQIAIRDDQQGASGAFGAIPLFVGTLLVSGIAMMVAVPVGLMSAIYLAEYANKTVRQIGKPMLEILAGIPTVVYGFFAALTLGPYLRDIGAWAGVSVSSESALAAGLVMGVMIIPFVSSLSDDVINAVPQSLRDGSYGLGATRSETIKKVIIPAALPGIIGGVLLAISRAIGETMIVVMAAGLSANMTINPLESVTTVTVQIVTLLVGDQEFDSPKTLAAFALGLVLFVVTLLLNIVALYVVRKYREQYE